MIAVPALVWTPPADLEEAARNVLLAVDAYRDALNGLGHDGPHDRLVHIDPCTNDFRVHVYEVTSDCAACGGAAYGTEDTLNHAYGDLRAALGQERKPWEE